MRYASILSFFLLLSFYLNSQINPDLTSIRNYTPEEYNASVQNWCAVQDHRGVMYFGNNDGILEYDGCNWTFIPVSNKSPIRSLAVDKNGTVFVGAVREFGCLKPDEFGNIKYISLSENLDTAEYKFLEIWNIYFMDNSVYFTSKEYMFKYDYYTINHFSNCHQKKYNHFILKFNDEFYLNNPPEGLFLVEDSLINAPDNKFFSYKYIMTMLPYKSDKALIGLYSNGIIVYDTKTGVDTINYDFPFETQDFLKNNRLYDGIRLDKNYAFGTINNGCIFTDENGKIIKYINNSTGIQNNTITSIYNNSFSNFKDLIWYTTSNGVSSVDINSPFSFINKDHGIKSRVTDIVRFKNKIYVSTSTDVFYLEYDKFKKPILKRIENIDFPWFFYIYKPQNVNKLSDKKNEILLVATNLGLYQIDGKTGKRIKGEGIKTDECFDMTVSKTDPSLLYLVCKKQLLLLQYKNQKWKKNKHILLDADIRAVLEDNSGSIWLSSLSSGIIKINQDMSKVYLNESHGLPSLNSLGIFELNNEIVFTASDGVYRFNENMQKFERHELFSKLYPDKNYGFYIIQEDNNHNIWVCRYKGNDYRIERIFKNNLGNYEIDSIPFKRFKFKEPETIYPEKNGIVWITSGDGVYKYNCNIKKEYNNKYNVLLRKITLNRDSVVFGGTNFKKKDSINVIDNDSKLINSGMSVLDNNFKSLRFDFSAPFFEAEEKTEFSRFLEGYDDNWSNWSNETDITYTGLPSGKFTFHVKAKNVYGIESDPVSYEFKIFPPWYRTIWAYAFYLILFVLIVIRLYTQRLRKQKHKLEKIVSERTLEVVNQKEEISNQRDHLDELSKKLAKQRDEIKEELKETISKAELLKKDSFKFQMKSIANQLNPHFMFNTLDAIKHFVIQNNIEKSDEYLGKFSKLMRLTLYNSLEDAIPLENELEALSLYLDLERLLSREKFSYSIDIDQSLDTKYTRIPGMLIQPFIENSLLHGIYNKTGKGKINMNFKKEGNVVFCTIEDDGIGIKKAEEFKKKRKGHHVSVGTKLIKERLKLISELHEREYNFNYSDIKDENSEISGTKVEIEIPIIDS